MFGLFEGILVTTVATILAVWINDKFDVGGDYIDTESTASTP